MKFNVIDIMAAIRLLEGKIYQQMINGNGVLVREIMMIYPDAATKVVYRKLRQEAKAKKTPSHRARGIITNYNLLFCVGVIVIVQVF